MIRALQLTAFVVLALAIGQASAQKSRIERTDWDTLSPESQRTIIVEDYREFVELVRPNLNYMRSGYRKAGKGFFLYVSHPLFTRHEFDAGVMAPAVERWVNKYQWHLRKAGINRVGFRTSDGAEAWFELK